MATKGKSKSVDKNIVAVDDEVVPVAVAKDDKKRKKSGSRSKSVDTPFPKLAMEDVKTAPSSDKEMVAVPKARSKSAAKRTESNDKEEVAVVKVKKAKKKEASEHEDIPYMEARARSASKAKDEPDKDMVPQAAKRSASEKPKGSKIEIIIEKAREGKKFQAKDIKNITIEDILNALKAKGVKLNTDGKAGRHKKAELFSRLIEVAS